ncbi:MAG TPA: hypothetical protein VMB05_12720 [Solirubrobacteraceae bacterium]|nr:hypothetical protein [Solirubrobacteraceae bacterium]
MTATAVAKGGSSFKTGTYKGSVGPQKIAFTVKRASCGGKTQLCVTLSKAPTSISCSGPAAEGGGPFGPLSGSVALPANGKVTQHTPVSEKTFPPPANLKETKKTGFTATFTKKGAVSGVFEMDVVQIEEGGSAPCTGREKFTAKLG